MFMVLRECRKNYCQAINIYAECYFIRERKSHMAFKRLLERFIAYGIVKEKKRKTATNDENILAAIQLNSTINVAIYYISTVIRKRM